MTASARSSTQAALGHYVYGIVEAGARPPLVDGVDPRYPARLLASGEVAALVGDAPLAEFGEGRLEENLNRPGWLEEKVRAHEAVLEAAQETGAVLPFRFGTVYLSEAHIHEMLVRERGELAAGLARVRGKREWGVKGLVDFEVLAEWLRSSEPAPADPSAEGEGSAYLARRQHERRAREDADGALLAVAEEAHARLSACAAEAALNSPRRTTSAKKARDVFLNGVYLVERSREAELQQAASELLDRFRDRGIHFDVTGPWPPYNFVVMEAGA
jgi:Gas vesicle synthesis protein GvpL/GvpF